MNKGKNFKKEVTEISAKRAEFVQEYAEELKEFANENAIEEVESTLDEHQLER